ncbi:Wound-induced protein WIN2 [Linum grandiflorum]
MVRVICACWRVLVLFLIASTSATSTELPDHRCYDLPYMRYECDPGRCCSAWNYCGITPLHCTGLTCLFQCTDRPGDVTLLSINNATFVKVTRNDDFDHRNSVSCANSLKDLSSASLQKYAWASFRVNNNAATASTCGRCLKLTNVETGGEAVVRVVHEPISSAASTESDEVGVVELGAAAFHKLCIYVDCGAGGHRDLVVKYSFESCD